MKELKNLLYVIMGVVFLVVLFVVCNRYAGQVKEENADQIQPSIVNGQQTPETESESRTAAEDAEAVDVEKQVQAMVSDESSSSCSIVLAGDILMQESQFESAYDSETEEFDFTPWFANISDILQSGDFTAATLKTTFAGQDNGAGTAYGGYGVYQGLSNAPETLADAMASAGISLVNTATNHAGDFDFAGISSTIGYLDDAKIEHVGTADSEDGVKTYVYDSGSVKVGFVGYTNSLNYALTEGGDYALNYLEDYSSDKMDELCSDVKALRKDGAYIVVVMLNFGSVDSDSIEEEQQTAAEQIAEAGADIIAGTGSTMVKPMEVLNVTDDDGNDHSCTVLYGMGVLLSSEVYDEDVGTDSDMTAVFKFNIAQNAGSAKVDSVAVYPVYENWTDDGTLSPVPVCKAKDAASSYSDELDEDDEARIEEGYTSVIERLTDDTGLSYDYKDYSYVISLQ